MRPRHPVRLGGFVFTACALVVALAAGASGQPPIPVTGQARVMTAATAGSLTPPRPTNGRIAFSGYVGLEPDPDGNSQVFTVNPDGTDVQQLTHLPAGSQAGNPGWSPDGRRIAYISNAAGTFAVWVMRADGTHQHQIAAGAGAEFVDPRWSPDGRHLVASRCNIRYGYEAFCDIVVMRPNGSGVRKVVGGHRVNVSPEYSPDGRRIVFHSDRAGYTGAIWVVRNDGEHLKRLTKPKLEAFWPHWSHDGRHILFTDNCCRSGNQVFVMRPDGTHVRRLTHLTGHRSGLFAAYSPNGRQIVLISNLMRNPHGPNDDLYTMRANGSHLRRIVADHPDVVMSDWGPAQ